MPTPHPFHAPLRRRTWRRAVLLLAGVPLTLHATSAVLYVARSDEPTLQAGATWARNHGYGAIVNRLEAWRYSKPPSTAPASELAAPAELLAPRTSSTTLPAAPTTSPAPSTTWAPAPLAPVLAPLPNEGEWSPLLTLAGRTVAWVTSLRPSAEFGSVRATHVRFEPSALRAVLYSGSSIHPPASRAAAWEHHTKVRAADRRDLALTFNGGFRFEHTNGGYKADGTVARRLVDGEASIAIDTDGRLHLGVYGRDLTDGPRWVSIRQNLPPIVDSANGVAKSMVNSSNRNRWGADYGGVLYVPRSALCDMGDGTLMWSFVGDVGPDGLADALVAAGCKLAVQLDINGTWPHFAVYDGLGTTARTPVLVDQRMENPSRFLNGSEKDFFALFAVPAP